MEKRAIKFRGMRKDGKGWVYGYYYSRNNTEHYILKGIYLPSEILTPAEVLPETVGQFTGKHDTSGIEIYSEDIMEFNDYTVPKGTDTKKRVDVKWDKNKLGWIGCFRGKVIGNIHQNPELLK